MGKNIPVWLNADGERTMVSAIELHEHMHGVIGALHAPAGRPLTVMLQKHVRGLTVELDDASGYFERPDEIFTSSTELKARTALRDSGLSDERINKALNALRNAGILLREKGEST